MPQPSRLMFDGFALPYGDTVILALPIGLPLCGAEKGTIQYRNAG